MACAWKTANSGLSTLLFEPKQGPIEKPCGEGIMPGALDVLDAMGVPHQLEVCRPFPGIRYFVPGAQPLAIDFPMSGRAYSRPVLDSLMRARLDSTVGFTRVGQKAKVERLSGAFQITSAEGTVFHAKWLIVADGAGGQTARWMRGPSELLGPRLGLRTRHQDVRGLDRVEIHMGQGVDFYMTPLPGGIVNAALMIENPPPGVHGAEALFSWALDRHPAVQERLGTMTTSAACVPLQHRYPQHVTDGRAFLIGDAGGVADPILGTGLAVALRTGFQAADAVLQIQRGASQAKVAHSFRRQARAERGPRQKLAKLLHFASTHERVTRGAVAFLHHTPGLAKRLAATAAGVRVQSKRNMKS